MFNHFDLSTYRIGLTSLRPCAPRAFKEQRERGRRRDRKERERERTYAIWPRERIQPPRGRNWNENRGVHPSRQWGLLGDDMFFFFHRFLRVDFRLVSRTHFSFVSEKREGNPGIPLDFNVPVSFAYVYIYITTSRIELLSSRNSPIYFSFVQSSSLVSIV